MKIFILLPPLGFLFVVNSFIFCRFTKCQHHFTYFVSPPTRPITSHLFHDRCRLRRQSVTIYYYWSPQSRRSMYLMNYISVLCSWCLNGSFSLFQIRCSRHNLLHSWFLTVESQYRKVYFTYHDRSCWLLPLFNCIFNGLLMFFLLRPVGLGDPFLENNIQMLTRKSLGVDYNVEWNILVHFQSNSVHCVPFRKCETLIISKMGLKTN